MSAIDELIEMYISEFGEDGRAVDAKKELSALREAAQQSVQADECPAGGLHNFVDCIIPDTVEECSKCGIRR